MAYHGMVHDSPVITLAQHMHKAHMSASDRQGIEMAASLGSMIDRWVAKRKRQAKAKRTHK